MKKKLLGIICVSLLMATGCAKIPKLANGEDLVAKIDGKEISADELYKTIKQRYGTTMLVNMIDDFIANKEIETDEDVEEYADSRIQQLKLQYNAAGEDFEADLLRAGFSGEEEYREFFILDYKKNMVVENYVKSKLTDKEKEKYYENEIFGDMTVRHILIDPKVTSAMTDEEIKKAESDALTKAKDLIKELNDGADFATLAKEHSDDGGTKEKGGLFENFNKTGTNAADKDFFEASLKLENNKYTTEPVKTQFGYHIILKVSSKEKPAYDLTLSAIEDNLYTEKIEADEDLSMKTWVEIRKKYNLEIIDTDVKDMYDSTIGQFK